MLSNIIFCIAASAATLVVALLALLSPSVRNKNQPRPCIALSLFVQPLLPPHRHQHPNHPLHPSAAAYVFHHAITNGPDGASRVIGRVRGLVLPDRSSLAAFNIVYVTFDTPEYSGSIGIEARKLTGDGGKEELVVVGGTGSFAFARGTAVLMRTARLHPSSETTFALRLKLELA